MTTRIYNTGVQENLQKLQVFVVTHKLSHTKSSILVIAGILYCLMRVSLLNLQDVYARKSGFCHIRNSVVPSEWKPVISYSLGLIREHPRKSEPLHTGN